MSTIKRAVVFSWILASALASLAVAQQPRPYDGIDAGIEAYHYHEGLRRAEVSEQLTLQRLLQRYPGMPGPADGPILYGPLPVRLVAPSSYVPWARPAEVWVPPYRPWAPQPLGQTHVQTAPNRWESHPIWDYEAATGREMPLPPAALPIPDVETPAPRIPREF